MVDWKSLKRKTLTRSLNPKIFKRFQKICVFQIYLTFSQRNLLNWWKKRRKRVFSKQTFFTRLWSSFGTVPISSFLQRFEELISILTVSLLCGLEERTWWKQQNMLGQVPFFVESVWYLIIFFRDVNIYDGSATMWLDRSWLRPSLRFPKPPVNHLSSMWLTHFFLQQFCRMNDLIAKFIGYLQVITIYSTYICHVFDFFSIRHTNWCGGKLVIIPTIFAPTKKEMILILRYFILFSVFFFGYWFKFYFADEPIVDIHPYKTPVRYLNNLNPFSLFFIHLPSISRKTELTPTIAILLLSPFFVSFAHLLVFGIPCLHFGKNPDNVLFACLLGRIR